MRRGIRGGTLYRFRVPARPARMTKTRTDHGACPSRLSEVDDFVIAKGEKELVLLL
jgi:hypothetical protein